MLNNLGFFSVFMKKEPRKSAKNNEWFCFFPIAIFMFSWVDPFLASLKNFNTALFSIYFNYIFKLKHFLYFYFQFQCASLYRR